MRICASLFILYLTAKGVTSAPTLYSAPSCRNLTISVTASADNLDLPPFPNDTSRAAFGKYVRSFDPSALGIKKVDGTFNIAATYCEPLIDVPGRENTIQFLLHGLAYTKEYWNALEYSDSSYPGEYSWTYRANSQGYATLAIDNLGNGESDRPDPIAIVQKPFQEAVILEIFKNIRSQNYSCITKKYENIILVTHSYGAMLGRMIAINHPDSVTGPNAYIQTASSSDLKGIAALGPNLRPQAASVVNPGRFSKLPPAYLHVDPAALRETVYGLAGEYDSKMLARDESMPHTFAVGELISRNSNDPSNFSGPVIYITGMHDAVVCDPNSNITLATVDCTIGKDGNPGRTALKFPNAKPFVTYAPAATGHNANLHYSAGEVFGAAHEFLEAAGF